MLTSPMEIQVMTTNYWIAGTSGDWSTASDWQSGVAPTATDDAVISNSNSVTVNGTAVAHSLSLNSSHVTISGSLSVGTSLVDGSGSELIMSGGSVSAQSISGNGYIFGYGVVNGAVTGGGIIIDAYGGTLEFTGPVASPVSFHLAQGTPTTVKLDQPGAFTGYFDSIAVGDTIDLVGVSTSSESFDGSHLTINETNGQQLVYNFNNISIAGDTLNVVTGSNGTEIYWTQGPITVSGGQTLNVSSGQTSNGVIVLSGGTLNVLSGGTASDTVDTGFANILSGGTAISTTVNADPDIGAGGTQVVSSGGTAVGTTVGG